MKTTTEILTYITKATALLLTILIFCSLTGLSCSAKPVEHLVTIMAIPDESVTYTDYDSAFMTLVNISTGESETFILYPHNNFTDKVLLAEAEYAVTAVGINGRYDLVYHSDLKRVNVDYDTSIAVRFWDSRLMENNTTIPEYTFQDYFATTGPSNTKPSQPSKPSATTPNNPNHPTSTTTSQYEPPTLFPIISTEATSSSEENPNNSTTEVTITNPYYSTTSITETTSNANQTPVSENDNLKRFIPIIIILFILSIICIVFFVLVNKKQRNK